MLHCGKKRAARTIDFLGRSLAQETFTRHTWPVSWLDMGAIDKNKMADKRGMASRQCQGYTGTPAMSNQRDLAQTEGRHCMHRVFRNSCKTVTIIRRIALAVSTLIKSDNLVTMTEVGSYQLPGIGGRSQAM